VDLLGEVQAQPDLDAEGAFRESLASGLHAEVAAMNRENFIVRMNREAVERFQNRSRWNDLNESDRKTLQRDLAGLPSEIEADEIECRMFDLKALRMQLALLEGDKGGFEAQRRRIVEIAMSLEEKTAIPAVAAQLAYLSRVQENEFWEGITLAMLEDLRLHLRQLMPFLDKKKRTIVYTDFKDEVMGVREEQALYIPKMTGAQYAKKVAEYLQNHLDDVVIHRLRANEPLTPTDLEGLEKTLAEIGEDDGETLLSGLLEQSGAPSLVYFVRNLVGMDRAAAQAAFSTFLGDRSLNTAQIRFIEMSIEQLTARGIMDAAALYEPPFSNLHAGGPDGLFAGKENVIEAVFQTLDQLKPGDEAGTG